MESHVNKKEGNLYVFIALGVSVVVVGVMLLYSSSTSNFGAYAEDEVALEAGDEVQETNPKPDTVADQALAAKVDEPAKVEVEPAKAEPAKADPAEPAKADPPKADPPKADPPKADPPKAEPANAEPAKAEPAKVDEKKAEDRACDLNVVATMPDKSDTITDVSGTYLWSDQKCKNRHSYYCAEKKMYLFFDKVNGMSGWAFDGVQCKGNLPFDGGYIETHSADVKEMAGKNWNILDTSKDDEYHPSSKVSVHIECKATDEPSGAVAAVLLSMDPEALTKEEVCFNPEADGGTCQDFPGFVDIGTPLWTRKDLEADLEEFLKVWERRPKVEKIFGMQKEHSYAMWTYIRHLKPKIVIESGVALGFGTWLYREAYPKIEKHFCIDPIVMSGFKEVDGVTYYIGSNFTDFSEIDWNSVIDDFDNTLVVFDDHQDAFRRVHEAAKFGFTKMTFDDNVPLYCGNQYSLKQVLQPPCGASDPLHIQKNLHEYKTKITMKEKYENCVQLYDMLEVYYEFPPISAPVDWYRNFADEKNQMFGGSCGGAETLQESYNFKESGFGQRIQKDEATYFEKLLKQPILPDPDNSIEDYQWICYVQLKNTQFD